MREMEDTKETQIELMDVEIQYSGKKNQIWIEIIISWILEHNSRLSGDKWADVSLGMEQTQCYTLLCFSLLFKQRVLIAVFPSWGGYTAHACLL